MTVYELIQELAKHKGDTEVEFHVQAEFDREDENDTQEVTVEAEFDENVNFYEIDDFSDNRYSPRIVINLEY